VGQLDAQEAVPVAGGHFITQDRPGQANLCAKLTKRDFELVISAIRRGHSLAHAADDQALAQQAHIEIGVAHSCNFNHHDQALVPFEHICRGAPDRRVAHNDPPSKCPA